MRCIMEFTRVRFRSLSTVDLSATGRRNLTCSGRGRLRNVGFQEAKGGLPPCVGETPQAGVDPKWPFSRKFSEQSAGFRRAIRSAAILIIAEYQRSITLPPRRNAQHCVGKQAAGQMLVEPAGQMEQ